MRAKMRTLSKTNGFEGSSCSEVGWSIRPETRPLTLTAASSKPDAEAERERKLWGGMCSSRPRPTHAQYWLAAARLSAIRDRIAIHPRPGFYTIPL